MVDRKLEDETPRERQARKAVERGRKATQDVLDDLAAKYAEIEKESK